MALALRIRSERVKTITERLALRRGENDCPGIDRHGLTIRCNETRLMVEPELVLIRAWNEFDCRLPDFVMVHHRCPKCLFERLVDIELLGLTLDELVLVERRPPRLPPKANQLLREWYLVMCEEGSDSARFVQKRLEKLLRESAGKRKERRAS